SRACARGLHARHGRRAAEGHRSDERRVAIPRTGLPAPRALARARGVPRCALRAPVRAAERRPPTHAARLPGMGPHRPPPDHAGRAPMSLSRATVVQFLSYLVVGGLSFLVELGTFKLALAAALPLPPASVLSFALANVANYFLCIKLSFVA